MYPMKPFSVLEITGVFLSSVLPTFLEATLTVRIPQEYHGKRMNKEN